MAAENADRYCVCISEQPQNLNEKAALLTDTRWATGGVIRVTFFKGEFEGSESLQQRVRDVANRWTTEDLANVQFQFVDEGEAEIRIAFMPGKGSWSYLGTVCQQIPVDKPTMNYGWLTDDSDDAEVQRVVLHEFGHALGLIHEHQNPKGGIKWNEPAVFADLSGPPNRWDEQTIRTNVLDHYPPEDVEATNVDPNSIMMYPIPKAWTLDGFSAGMNGDLSDLDKQLIRDEYPRSN